MSEERFKRLAAILIALVTVAGTIIAFLQSDAGARDDRANRDTKRYSMEAMGRKVSGDSRVNFDYNGAYQAWYELDLLAASATARGDEAAAKRYQTLRDETARLSPLLTPPYFKPDTGETDITRYETEVYVVEITLLTERFTAASGVKEAWDSKSNTYIVHLTLLAVALFLYGLAVTISGQLTRWIFMGVGSAIAIVALIWAGAVFTKPVPDLREKTGAIEAYAEGVGLAYQDKHVEALAAFDKALGLAPDYANAFLARAESKQAQGDLAGAINDFEQARANGDETANTAGELAWAYYLNGRFDDAVNMNRTALKATPDELWIQFDLALSLLAAGKTDEAKAEYQAGIDTATKQVVAAKAAGQQAPSFLWAGLDDATTSLDDLIDVLDTGEGQPAPSTIGNREAVRAAADTFIQQLKSQSVSLEYTGQSPQGTLTAQVSPFTFALPIRDEQGEIQDYEEATDTFEFGVQEVAVLFDYAEMRDGQSVIFKVYIDDVEDPSWRVLDPWALGASGTAQKLLSLAYSDNFVLGAGFYVVEMYVDGHLAQRGSFVVQQ